MISRVNGTELHSVRHGRGRPMLVMHGGLGWDHTYLRPYLDPLGDLVELIYYDHRGNGRSARSADYNEIDHSLLINDAGALLDQLGIEQAVLFGHSYGGYLAQEFALRYPERVSALVLCATAPALDFLDVIMGNAAARATPAQLQAVGAAFSGPSASDAQLEEVFLEILPLYFHRAEPSRYGALFRDTIYSAGAFNRGVFGCLVGFNTLGNLGKLALPTLVLAGANDWIAPVEQGAARLCAGIPDATCVIFEQSGHFPFVEEAERFQQVLCDWLRQRV